MGSIQPDEPETPWPLPGHSLSGTNGPVGVNREDWNETTEDWFTTHPAFTRINYTAEGQPAGGHFQVIWEEVRAVQQYLTRPVAPRIAEEFGDPSRYPRQILRRVIGKCEYIGKAVCLGLGEIEWKSKTEYNKAWIEQCGLFLAICQLLEERQGMKPNSMIKFFQDPAFKIEDRWILDKIGQQNIIEHPAANEHMGQGSFVYAPRFPANFMLDTFLAPGREPDLLYTSTVHGSLGSITWPIVNHWFNEVYWSGNPTITAEALHMYRVAKEFDESHEGIVYWGAYSISDAVRAAYCKSSFYLPKSRPVAPPSGQQAS